jgi:hypothetical protein
MKQSQIIGELKTILRPFSLEAKPKRIEKALPKKFFAIEEAIKGVIAKKPQRPELSFYIIEIPDYIPISIAHQIVNFFKFIPFRAFLKEEVVGDRIEPFLIIRIIACETYALMLGRIIEYLFNTIYIYLAKESRYFKREARKKRRKARKEGIDFKAETDARKHISSKRIDIMHIINDYSDRMMLDIVYNHLPNNPAIDKGLQRMKEELMAKEIIKNGKEL